MSTNNSSRSSTPTPVKRKETKAWYEAPLMILKNRSVIKFLFIITCINVIALLGTFISDKVVGYDEENPKCVNRGKHTNSTNDIILDAYLNKSLETDFNEFRDSLNITENKIKRVLFKKCSICVKENKFVLCYIPYSQTRLIYILYISLFVSIALLLISFLLPKNKTD